MNNGYHLPVMLAETVGWLITERSGRYVDATLGGGGHSSEILSRLDGAGRLDSFDRDGDAIAEARRKIGEDRRWTAHHTPFGEMGEQLPPGSVSGVLMDLGISSHQVDTPERGFSFRRSATADLRMDRSAPVDASEWIGRREAAEVARTIALNGDLRYSKRAAQVLVDAVGGEGKLKMAAVMEAARIVSHGKRSDDAAARILQALRMEINDEMGELERGLNGAHSLLKSGGRLVVLTYHSGEDRLVKQKGQEWSRDCLCPDEFPVCVCGGKQATFRSLLKTPGRPTPEEEEKNPRSRSAKLRVYERL